MKSPTNKRAEELKKIFDCTDENVSAVISPLIDELVFVEAQLADLKTKPFIKYHPQNPAIQKQTPAGKLYKELLAQQKDIVRILCGQLRKSDGEDESPLRAYLKELANG